MLFMCISRCSHEGDISTPLGWMGQVKPLIIVSRSPVLRCYFALKMFLRFGVNFEETIRSPISNFALMGLFMSYILYTIYRGNLNALFSKFLRCAILWF